MRCSLFFTLCLIVSWQSAMAQLSKSFGGEHWAGKFGLYMRYSDSTGPEIPSFNALQVVLKADTLFVFLPPVEVYSYKQRDSIAYLKPDSSMARENAVFRVEANSDSIVLLPLNFQAKNLLLQFGMSHAPMLWYLTPQRPDYFPQKASNRDKLIFYPIGEMVKNIPWDKLYLSVHQPQYYWFLESNFDLSISRNGLVQIDCESGQQDGYDDDATNNRKSYQMQLSKGQMDTLMSCLNMQIMIPFSYGLQNIAAYQSSYQLQFDDYDARFWWRTDNSIPSTILGLQVFIQTLVNNPHKKEIPFAGFKSPCSFVKIRN